MGPNARTAAKRQPHPRSGYIHPVAAIGRGRKCSATRGHARAQPHCEGAQRSSLATRMIMLNFAPGKDEARLRLLLGLPSLTRASSAAYAFGKYFKAEAASRTLVFVFPDTLPEPLVTRETVAIETPASLATSLMVHGARYAWASSFFPTWLAQRTWPDSRPDRRSSNRVICCSLPGHKILKGSVFGAAAQHST